MNKREAKRQAYLIAARMLGEWLGSDWAASFDGNGLSGADQDRLEEAVRELRDQLEDRGEGRGG